MLAHHVTSPVSIARLQATSCWPHLDGYTDWLVARHYTSATIELFLFGVVPLGQWLAAHDIPLNAFDHHALEAFRRDRDSLGQWRHRGHGPHKIKAAFNGARRFHEYLVAIGLVEPAPSPSPLPSLLTDFERWMCLHKGVRAVTLANHTYYLRHFVAALGEVPGDYDAVAVRRYLYQIAEHSPVPTARAASGSIRVFLRYLEATGQAAGSLSTAVPRIREVRLAALPRHLLSDNVERLIDSCARMPLTARRDRAVLLLLARLALRAGDVAMLELADVDWRGARLRLDGKNRQQTWLPLPQEVGDALVDYIRGERPVSEEPRLFLKSIAPLGPLTRTVVSSIVRRAIERTGIDAPSRGAHLLRHSAAREMLAHGATLGQIGSVLRHAHIDTTAIYAKVDTGLLEGVATPWPERRVGSASDVERAAGELSC